MISEERRQGVVVGFLVSLAIHLPVAAIPLWPGGPVLQAFLAAARDPVVGDARSQAAAPALPGPNVKDSSREDLIPRSLGESSSSLSDVDVDSGKIAKRAARENDHLDASSEFVRGARTTSNASRPPRDRDVAMLPALVEASWSRRDGRSVFQSIENITSSFQSHAGKWINHLWQSTVFAVVAGFLAIAFRRNRASVRYWLWFSASVKFFVPFALLINLGSQLQWAPTAQKMAEQSLAVTMERISQPFPDSWPSGLWTASSTPDTPSWTGLAVLFVWACGFGAIASIRLRLWRRIRATVRASTPLKIRNAEIPTSVEVRAAPGLLEPGVVGFWRPILLLPAGIHQHLTPAQLNAVLAHELCHIERRDNLTAASHMIVEAVFWFHPVVWWIGARLVDERERACDEHVLRIFGDPRAYADGILNLCKRYVDARLACVSGVSGSDLKKRIEAIMRNQDGEVLGSWRKLLLAAAGIATIVAPIVIGTLSAPLLRAQSPTSAAGGPAFETASVKPNRSSGANVRLDSQPGGRLTVTNLTAAGLIQVAYDRSDFQVFGGPNWLDSDRFDVVAKAEGDPTLEQKRLMLRRLLAERFKLTVHTETRELPFYALVVASSDGRLGPRLRRTEVDCARAEQSLLGSAIGPSPRNGPAPCGFFGFAPGTQFSAGRGGLAFRGLTMAALAKRFVPMLERSVSDQTGLSGYFDGDFDFIAELPIPPPPPGVPSPFLEPFVSVFTVFPEQLGLKLDSRRGPVEVLVIDRAEQPTPD